MLSGKNIVLGLTGCSTVCQASELVSRLMKLHANVDVIMTKNATEFVAPLTFRNLTKNPVLLDLFANPVSWDRTHKPVAEKADLLLIAPASANSIGKAANGIADDLLSVTILSTEAPVFFAPHMNPKMYQKPSVQRNLQTLQADGYEIIRQDRTMPNGTVISSLLADTDVIIEAVKRRLIP